MSGEEAYERARSDPDFLARFARAYGRDDPLEALRQHAEQGRHDALPSDSAEALYGRAADEARRRRVAAELEARRRDRALVATAIERAEVRSDDPSPTRRNAVSVEGPAPDGVQQRPAPPRPPWLRLAGVAAVLALTIGAYLMGASAGSAPRPAPRSTALPTVLFYDDRDGQVARLALGPGSNGRRSTEVHLPEMLRGWSVSMACLSRVTRPRVVPTQTVLLLGDRDRQIGSWRVPCDTVERRFSALPAPANERIVRLVLVLDDATVSAGWVTMDPTPP